MRSWLPEARSEREPVPAYVTRMQVVWFAALFRKTTLRVRAKGGGRTAPLRVMEISRRGLRVSRALRVTQAARTTVLVALRVH